MTGCVKPFGPRSILDVVFTNILCFYGIVFSQLHSFCSWPARKQMEMIALYIKFFIKHICCA
jgi:hypothetical protein